MHDLISHSNSGAAGSVDQSTSTSSSSSSTTMIAAAAVVPTISVVPTSDDNINNINNSGGSNTTNTTNSTTTTTTTLHTAKYNGPYSYKTVTLPPHQQVIVHNQPFSLVHTNPPIEALSSSPTSSSATTPMISVLSPQLQQQMLLQKKRISQRNNSGPPEIPPEEINFDPKTDLLGGGAYGKVYKATCRGKPVAVKVPKKQTLSESELKAFQNEVAIWKQIFHPNVVMCMGACTKPGKIMIVSELMRSDLEKLIHRSPEPPPLYQRMKMALDAALGMNWLHGINNILHRDLKLANLMIGKDNTVKITDFGFSQALKSGTTTTDQRGPKGTALYMAPEVMQKKEFNEKADVYSFGLILYELATCEELFPDYSEMEEFSNAICNLRLRPTVPNHLPKSLAMLMQRCWDHDSTMRPSFSEVSQKMNEVLIDIAISEPSAATFWKTSFNSPDDVKWSDFSRKLSESTGVDINDIQPISKLLISTKMDDDDENGFVNIDRFDLMTKWFGRFYGQPRGATTTSSESVVVLKEMATLVSRRWFHFDIARDVSERRLRSRPENTFLIRLSLNDPIKSPFTISKIKSTKPMHKRVNREDVPVSSDYPMGIKLMVPVENTEMCFNSVIAMVDKLKSIGNLGPECPHTEIKVPYVND
ncbi:hypothetical protein SAMD00019534_068930 [Acytostelium subglobosum LB1]|uniref:hypothetical protein n=1 Tax=Acytostelium subglobosum LB1 TaxID=1410327 RepID=UPI000644BD67|nr:hypothetical protein SAMD00019534_068930 [Acytostelium subglobosum LB1]GAM23718.1 hypothetical protein SAMD00019534_068930 [Acytostelium subglobosum LB1]|eukprot:XP_012753459.1 hypothetical protein SAMD00019534_068930 [Acytostelium subglobosum LB1]